MKDKTIGIIGGMGPEATIDIFNRIVTYTHVVDEQDHIRILIDNNPKMPSRQDAILKGQKSPLPDLIAMAKGLQEQGADFLIMAANTPHYYYRDIQAHLTIPFLHMLEETAKAITQQFPSVKQVGLLATLATIKTGIYQEVLHTYGLTMVTLEEKELRILQKAIFTFKEGGNKQEFFSVICTVAKQLINTGSEVLILGCTEIPLVFTQEDCLIPIIDPNDIIARVAVKKAKEK